MLILMVPVKIEKSGFSKMSSKGRQTSSAQTPGEHGQGLSISLPAFTAMIGGASRQREEPLTGRLSLDLLLRSCREKRI